MTNVEKSDEKGALDSNVPDFTVFERKSIETIDEISITSYCSQKNGHKDFDLNWMKCTRYNPPPRTTNVNRKLSPYKKRKLGRNPRIPFSGGQLKVLEEHFRMRPYLGGNDVAQLSSSLGLSETKVKIWFQNRRARERKSRAENPDERRTSSLLTSVPLPVQKAPVIFFTSPLPRKQLMTSPSSAFHYVIPKCNSQS